MYVWHKYWGRKTWNVVGEYIRAYCPPGGTVLDPFVGSGVVAIEALKAGRKVIACDLLPISIEITRLTLKPVDLASLRRAFERVAGRAKERILKLYETPCRNCGRPISFTCAVWKQDECSEVRYQSCPHCGDRQERDCAAVEADRILTEKIEGMRIRAWYPQSSLYYPDGSPLKEKQRYESLDQLFTKRNLMALAWLMEAIEEDEDRTTRDFLKIAFTSMVHLCSRMIAISNPLPTSHHTAFSSTGWTQQSYWYARSFMEQNVWEKFESAVLGHQGLIKAKAESNDSIPRPRFARRLEEVLTGRADAYLHCGDALDLMSSIAERHGSVVDYIFTDPPYDASIQYGELGYLWVAWLKKDAGYLDQIMAKEIVRNERQQKSFDVYHALLSNAFRRMYDVLKPDGYLTLTFHNPTFKVRNATIHAGVTAAFNFEKIHHQPLGQLSAKAMLQPFGSALGDFYLRFHKPPAPGVLTRPEEIDATRFERVVIETAKRVLAERGEPTPYTILINAIDPELARNGYFSQLRSGLDVRTVLKRRLKSDFILLDMELGSTTGKGWWFREPLSVPHLKTVPLAERVEQTVLRKLQERGRVTFTDMWKAVSEEFPNALTTDSTRIRDALEAYARPVGHGQWLLKPEYHQDRIRRMHTRMIAILAMIGKASGYDIWIGRREQGDPLSEGFPGREGELRQYCTRSSLRGAENARNLEEVENIDIVWLRGRRIEALFEVEATTSMTEALKRGSNVEPAVPKYVVIPKERQDQLNRKLHSPLFGERFEADSWKAVFAEVLSGAYDRRGKQLDIHEVVAQTAGNKPRHNPQKKQLSLFDSRPPSLQHDPD